MDAIGDPLCHLDLAAIQVDAQNVRDLAAAIVSGIESHRQRGVLNPEAEQIAARLSDTARRLAVGLALVENLPLGQYDWFRGGHRKAVDAQLAAVKVRWDAKSAQDTLRSRASQITDSAHSSGVAYAVGAAQIVAAVSGMHSAVRFMEKKWKATGGDQDHVRDLMHGPAVAAALLARPGATEQGNELAVHLAQYADDAVLAASRAAVTARTYGANGLKEAEVAVRMLNTTADYTLAPHFDGSYGDNRRVLSRPLPDLAGSRPWDAHRIVWRHGMGYDVEQADGSSVPRAGWWTVVESKVIEGAEGRRGLLICEQDAGEPQS